MVKAAFLRWNALYGGWLLASAAYAAWPWWLRVPTGVIAIVIIVFDVRNTQQRIKQAVALEILSSRPRLIPDQSSIDWSRGWDAGMKYQKEKQGIRISFKIPWFRKKS